MKMSDILPQHDCMSVIIDLVFRRSWKAERTIVTLSINLLMIVLRCILELWPVFNMSFYNCHYHVKRITNPFRRGTSLKSRGEMKCGQFAAM